MKSKCNFGQRVLAIVGFSMAISVTFIWPGSSVDIAMVQAQEPEFTTDFRLEDCEFMAVGRNPYFILEPGYQLVLEGEENADKFKVVSTVLYETENISLPNIGVVKTGIVEDREWKNNELTEVSRNFYAICKRTNSVYYFGENVDKYENGEIVSHEGSWRAGVSGAKPGVMMPGIFLLGSRYYQEIAEGVAMDRGENVEMGLTITTEAGIFNACVKVRETTPLEPTAVGEKVYCPRVGLVVDDELKLVKYGFNVINTAPTTGITTYNYPNPFNPVSGIPINSHGITTRGTIIKYQIPGTGETTVNIKIYNIAGELIREFTDTATRGVWNYVEWDGKNSGGTVVASEVYIYIIEGGGYHKCGKMAIIK
ncbi:MAG: hypothetical protein AB1414_03345 [bacterium]